MELPSKGHPPKPGKVSPDGNHTEKKKRTTRTGLYKVDWNQYVKPLLPLMQAFTTLEKYGQKVEQQSGYTE